MSKRKSIHSYNTNDFYIDTYSRPEVHKVMLQDQVRTKIYQQALSSQSLNLYNKTVLDIGCGTGILSLFAADAGAKHVVGVDISAMVEIARENVINNGFENKISVFRGRVEDFIEKGGFEVVIENRNGNKKEKVFLDKFDVIVSEWMGYALIYEGMLDSVVQAREAFLKENGVMLPDKANLYWGWVSTRSNHGPKKSSDAQIPKKPPPHTSQPTTTSQNT